MIPLGNEPFHPPRNFNFPVKIEKSGKKRICNRDWFDEFSWLHWSDTFERVFCYYCTKASQQQKLTNKKPDKAFIEIGFQTWSKGKAPLRAHQNSECHREAIEKLVILPKTSTPVQNLLFSQSVKDKCENRECLKIIISTLILCGRHNLYY